MSKTTYVLPVNHNINLKKEDNVPLLNIGLIGTPLGKGSSADPVHN
jgi:hypothetical protein